EMIGGQTTLARLKAAFIRDSGSISDGASPSTPQLDSQTVSQEMLAIGQPMLMLRLWKSPFLSLVRSGRGQLRRATWSTLKRK
ncbi:hypothetical protein HN51_045265, partial [Arachis hypogaea]